MEIEATDEQLKRVVKLAQDQLAWEATIVEIEAELEAAQKSLAAVKNRELPELLKEIGLSEIKLNTGEKVALQSKIKASISEANRAAAFAWLREKGFGSLIKDEIVTRFGMGEERLAKKLYEDLVKKGYDVTEKESVHSQTLSAFAKEQLEKGAELPMDLLGVFQYEETKITKKK